MLSLTNVRSHEARDRKLSALLVDAWFGETAAAVQVAAAALSCAIIATERSIISLCIHSYYVPERSTRDVKMRHAAAPNCVIDHWEARVRRLARYSTCCSFLATLSLPIWSYLQSRDCHWVNVILGAEERAKRATMDSRRQALCAAEAC